MTIGHGTPLVFTEHYVPVDLSFEVEVAKRLIHVYDRTQAVIYVSEDNLKNFRAKFPSLPSQKCMVIPNGINLQMFQEKYCHSKKNREKMQTDSTSKEKIRMVAAGRLTAQKGIDLLIKAVGSLAEDEKQKISLDIWGEGPDVGLLEEMVSKYELYPIVHFYPWTDESCHLFSSYDLFIFPSRHEGLPFTLLEALASGIPTITSDIPVHLWITQQGRHALLFQSDNADSLCLALRKWLKHLSKESSSSLVENCHDWLREHFDQNKNLSATIKIWEQLTSQLKN
jgi:glycosyltransferase involved in cell wall biosynthesis